jgi:hypothetical protein
MISSNDPFYSQEVLILDEFDKNRWRNRIHEMMFVSFRLLFNTGVSFGFTLEGENTYLVFFFCFLDRAFFNYEENNQQNALIVSLINLLIYNYSNMFRPLS